MATHHVHRYRVEDGRFCIDIRVKTYRQLFDGRDPAPFRERDLDDRAVEYLVGALLELPRKSAVKLIFWIAEEPASSLTDATLVEAVRAYFEHEANHLDRKIQQHIRRAQVFLVVGLTVLVVFLALAELTAGLPDGTVRRVLREGLVITGWVAMWRPLEALLYDWWPLLQERQLRRRLRDAPMEVHRGAETTAGSAWPPRVDDGTLGSAVS